MFRGDKSIRFYENYNPIQTSDTPIHHCEVISYCVNEAEWSR